MLTILALRICILRRTKHRQNAKDLPNNLPVHYMGALKNIMHKGDLSAQASLSDFDTTLGETQHLVYAHVKDCGNSAASFRV